VKQKKLDVANVQQVRLDENTVIKPFDCADKDLNDFLLNDAKNYAKSLLAVTYLFETDTETIAYYSLSNDNLTKDEESKADWNRVNRAIANEKRRKAYPAVKIGRLAVAKQFAGLGFGRRILKSVWSMYADYPQQSGCRFITVDAYNTALPFYEKNKFKYLTTKDATEETRAMYFDLKAF
jgi:GNAT superfamily N-acetyltransferase